LRYLELFGNLLHMKAEFDPEQFRKIVTWVEVALTACMIFYTLYTIDADGNKAYRAESPQRWRRAGKIFVSWLVLGIFTLLLWCFNFKG